MDIVLIVIVVLIFISMSSSMYYFMSSPEPVVDVQPTSSAYASISSDIEIPSQVYVRKTFSTKGCDSDDIVMTCADNMKIKDAIVTYGRWDNTLCPDPSVTPTTQPKSKVYNISKARGKNTYTIKDKTSEPNIKEDIYPGVYKHWRLDYKCE